MDPPVTANDGGEEKTRIQPAQLPFQHWEGQGDAVFSKEEHDICAGGFDGRTVFYPEGEGAAQCGIGRRERSDVGNSGRGRFFWRRRARGAAPAHVVRNCDDGMRAFARGEKRHDASVGTGTKIVDPVSEMPAEAQHPISGRPGGSAFQFQREAAGARTPVDGAIWQRGRIGNVGAKTKPGNAGGDGGNDAVAGQLFHEPVSEAGIYQLRPWRSSTRQEFAAECCASRR